MKPFRLVSSITLVVALLVVSSCGLDEGSAPPTGATTPGVALDPGTIVVDSARLFLVSTAAERAEGVLRFQAGPSAPEIKPGNVVVGAQGRGFLRRVESVERQGSYLVLRTTPAALSDAIRTAHLHLQIPLTDATPRPENGGPRMVLGPPETMVTAPGVTFDGRALSLDNVTLANGRLCGVQRGSRWQDQGCVDVRLGVEKGRIELDGNLDMDADFGGTALQRAHLVTEATLRFDMDAFAEVTGEVGTSFEKSLGESRFPFGGFIGLLPVKGDVVVRMVAEASLTTPGVRVNAGFNSTTRGKAGAQYVKGQGISRVWVWSSDLSPLPVRIAGTREAELRVWVRPEVSVEFYGESADVYFGYGPYARLGQTLDVPAGKARWEFATGKAGELGVDFALFGWGLGSVYYSLPPSGETVWARGDAPLTPTAARLEIVSGAGQRAEPNRVLSAPVVVRVLDARGAPVKGVLVSFRANTGDGSFTPASATSNAAGNAEARWKLGTVLGSQAAEAFVQGTDNVRIRLEAVASTGRAPSVGEISPTVFPSSSAEQSLTVEGRGFARGARLSLRVNNNTYEVGGSKVTVSADGARLVARISPGTTPATWTGQVVNPDGWPSERFTFRVERRNAPTLGNVSPDPAPAVSAEQTLTLTGTGFASGAKLVFRVNGSTYEVKAPKVTVESASRLTARVTLGPTPATWAVQVVNPDGGASQPRSFRVAGQPPAISGISPDPALGTAAEQTLTLTGTGFASGAKLVFRVSGNTYEVKAPKVTVESATRITARVSLGTTAATWTVQVVNANGAVSTPRSFRVSGAPPSIRDVSPNPVPAGAGERTLAITGGGFVPGARLVFRVNGNAYDVRSPKAAVESATRITARVTLGATPAIWTVQVVNPDGGVSGQHSFRVEAAAPVLSSVSPSVLPATNQEQTLALAGGHFLPGAWLRFRVNGNTYEVRAPKANVESASRITVRVTLGTTPATWTVQVVNPDGKASSPVSFRVEAPALYVRGVSPNPFTGSENERVLVVHGDGFLPGASLAMRVNGNTYTVGAAAVTVLNTGELRARVVLGPTPAWWTVQVVNPGGAASGMVGFPVVAPAPVLRSVSPNPFPATGQPQTITLHGSDFATDATLLFRVNGNAYAVRGPDVSWRGTGQIQARVNLGTTPAWWTVEVVNPGGRASAPLGFAVR